jgi:hypothetical protein
VIEQAAFPDGGGDLKKRTFGDLTVGEWHHMDFDYDLDAKKTTVIVDGERRGDGELQLGLPSPAFLRLGVAFSIDGDAVDFYYDDFGLSP